MLCYRAVDTTADEEGGGRDEKYEGLRNEILSLIDSKRDGVI